MILLENQLLVIKMNIETRIRIWVDDWWKKNRFDRIDVRQKVKDLLNIYNKNKDHIEERKVPTKTDYLMGMAFVASCRSKDSQTHHGCVIADDRGIILGTGYNSFPPDLPDFILPNTRPNKYKWIPGHSEINALNNMAISPKFCNRRLSAYVTGKPCLSCLQQLYANDIKVVYYAKRKGWELDKEQEEDWNDFVEMSGLIVTAVPINLEWIHEGLQCIS